MRISRDTASEDCAVRLHALDRSQWLRLQEDLKDALASCHLESLAAPTIHLLHDLLDSSLKSMHLEVFRRIVETDFGLVLDQNDEQLEGLYKTELNEHGSQNIARFCQAENWFVAVTIHQAAPLSPDGLFQIDLPVPWDRKQCQTEMLIDALGFQLEAAIHGDGSRLILRRRASRQAAAHSPVLMDSRMRHGSVNKISGQLGYGLIRFSAVGGIIAVSPSMLARLRLEQLETSVPALAAAIPVNFFNDIIWGLALDEGNGAFENYRIRVHLPDAGQLSILFNISGFRQADGTIHTLWQEVSQDEGSAKLAQGSIMSEVRVHNITRSYVPQLVAQKAREAVRLGKTGLTNEETRVAVLFCDIVGFTSYVESNAGAESIIDTLNSILRRVSGSVTGNRGAVDKFMGDCIMALFDDPTDAVFAALDMQSHSEDINSLRIRADQQTLQLRVGIHWGEVVIGNVGTVERLDWTAIGDVVNTASRIEKGCTPGSILISGDVRDQIDPVRGQNLRFSELFHLQVKGKRDELQVCHVSLADK